MAKKSRGTQGRAQNKAQAPENYTAVDRPTHKAPPPLQAKTPNQKTYINSIEHNTITIGTGPAGSGKSYVATALAADLLAQNKIEKLILTRPLVEAGEKMGFLPGTMDEKMLPYLLPVLSILHERLGVSFTDYLIKTKRIVGLPLAFARGHTFKDCFVLLDEAQNMTASQMKLFLTRIGEDCTVVINGDVSQKDLHNAHGLEDAIRRIGDLKGVGHVAFNRDDIVRSGLCQAIVDRYAQ